MAEIDRGFVHPTFPAQVIVSYYQAGKICDYISERWGESKLLDMIHEFAKNRPTVDVIKEQLGIEPEAFDKDFLAMIDKETSKTVAGFADWTIIAARLFRRTEKDKRPRLDTFTRWRIRRTRRIVEPSMRRHASSPVMGRVIAFEQERFIPLHVRKIVPSMFRVEMDREDFAAPMRINQSINHEIRRIDTRTRVGKIERRVISCLS